MKQIKSHKDRKSMRVVTFSATLGWFDRFRVLVNGHVRVVTKIESRQWMPPLKFDSHWRIADLPAHKSTQLRIGINRDALAYPDDVQRFFHPTPDRPSGSPET